MCVGVSGGRLKGTDGWGSVGWCPTEMGGGGLSRQLAQMISSFFLFFFRKLGSSVFLLESIYFHLFIIEMNTITINEKESCKYVVNIYKEDPLSCRCSHWRTCSVE